MDMEYLPSDKTADRAVELWKRMLRNPKYDNLGESRNRQPIETLERDLFAQALVRMKPNNCNEERLQKFGEELKRRMLDKKTRQDCAYLCVDYGPDAQLHACAQRAGLDMEFPWKTRMAVHRDYLYVTYGYGAPQIFHYWIPETNSWLVTSLHGTREDIGKLVEFVRGGELELTVEQDGPLLLETPAQ